MSEENPLKYLVSTCPIPMTEQVSYAIWGSVICVTKAFGQVSLKVDSNINRVFVLIELKKWGKLIPFMKDRWLKKAERNVKQYLPEGWRQLVYYGTNDSKG